MKTRITEILGIEYPILQGGMAWVAEHNLAAAVSEAGGLGIIGAGGVPAEFVRGQVQEGEGGAGRAGRRRVGRGQRRHVAGPEAGGPDKPQRQFGSGSRTHHIVLAGAQSVHGKPGTGHDGGRKTEDITSHKVHNRRKITKTIRQYRFLLC